MIDIADVKTLTIGQDQVLVVQVDGMITSEMQQRIADAFRSQAPNLKDRLLIIDRSITLSVIDAP